MPRISTAAAAIPQTIAPKLITNRKRTDAILFFEPAKAGRGVVGAMDALNAAEQLPRGPQRKSLVFNSLEKLTTAARAQALPAATVEALEKAGKLEGVDTLNTINAVRLRGVTPAALKRLAGPNVTAIVPDEKIQLQLPDAYTDAVDGAAAVSTTKPSSDTTYIDWGVKKMNAPAAWAQGVTGAGIVVASLDTGVITDHPGLKANFRGTRPDGTQDFNYNWYNGVEKGGKTPMDDVGHGTHTIGNAVGYDPNNIIGVAPDAKFIAARGLGQKGGTMWGLMGGMEWMQAPTDLDGKNPRPELAPDIVTNSWGGANQSNPFLWSSLKNWRKAGIVPLFASGNTGGNGAEPGSVSAPGLYGETITVGATDKDDKRAYFSNRGPSNYSNDVKPEIMAPGVKVYSAWTDGTFRDTFIIDGKEHPASGTSMATPHAAGAVALYMQAHPNAKFDEILHALEATATDPEHKNNDTGYGRVQPGKLIGTPDKDAKLTPQSRVDELLGQVNKAQVFGETPPTPKAKSHRKSHA
jgi:bacillopeptidase F